MPLVSLSFKTICWAKLWTSSEKRQQPWMIQCLPYSMTVMGAKTVMTSYYASSIIKLCRAAGSWWKLSQQECSLCKALTRIYINSSLSFGNGNLQLTPHLRSNCTWNLFCNSFLFLSLFLPATSISFLSNIA